jgi:hypothetical protein
MSLNFNRRGYLYETISLSYEEFKHHFGTNSRRMDQISNALQFFRIFHSCGCQTVFVDGSFVSMKKYPEDIDLCFDITGVPNEKMEELFPQFFDPNEIGKIHRNSLCHIFHFNATDTTFFDFLQNDRDGYIKGLVKLNLKDIPVDL